MKKILSVFAAAAVLFGFVSCSGDLHDQEPLQLPFIIGDMFGFTVYRDSISTETIYYLYEKFLSCSKSYSRVSLIVSYDEYITVSPFNTHSSLVKL